MFICTANDARPHPRAAARPHGDHRARRLHRGREAPDRQALPRPAPDRAQRAEDARSCGSPTRRCARSSATTRARPACASSSARSARSPQGRARGRRGAGNGDRASIGEAASARELLGPPRFTPRPSAARACRASRPGLAWTPVGGDVLFIEATAMRGNGELQITGQLGDVMKESAQAALSYVRGHLSEVAPELPSDWFEHHDLHLHVPAGRDPEGRAERRHHDGDRARVAAQRPPGARRRRDDRRDHAHRPGAADRRAEGEGARRAAQRDRDGHRAGAQRGRRRGDPRAPAREADVPLRRADRRGARARAGASRRVVANGRARRPGGRAQTGYMLGQASASDQR